MEIFTPGDDEKVHFEAPAVHFKSTLSAVNGYAFLTSKRFVFVESDSAPFEIVFTINVDEISKAEVERQGLGKKTVIYCKTGDKYGVGIPESWLPLLKDISKLKSDSTKSAADFIDDGKAWYYEQEGKKIGPISSQRMRQLASNNHTIYRFTKIWCEGMNEWKPADQTEILSSFQGPPPLSGDAVDNRIVWLLAFAPIISGIIESQVQNIFEIERNLWVLGLIVNVALSMFDEKKLNEAGHNTRALGLGSAWLVPVYLFKRAKVLKHNKAYFVVWIVSFFFDLFFL